MTEISVHGEKAQKYFFLVLQHFQHDLVFLDRVAKSLKTLARINEATSTFYPDIVDKIALAINEKQIFGTLIKCTGKKAVFSNGVIDTENLDLRRSIYGLKPYKERLKQGSKHCARL